MIHRILASSFILAAGLAVQAQAASRAETSKDWTATVDEVDTGEDVRKTCSAWTAARDAAGRDWTLKIAIGNGDALPPDAYPAIIVTAADGGLPAGENQPAVFGFGDQHVDARVSGGGNEVTVNNVTATSLALLKAFAQGSTLDLALSAKPPASFSLSGFTAAYRKLGGWCGFATNEVTK